MYLVLLHFPPPSNPNDQKYTASQVDAVSVIIPCFNEAKNIERKINELIRECQSFDNFEIIIINDGSTDSTHKVIEKFVNFKNVRIIQLDQRKGKTHALNLGVSMSNFDILVFTDARQMIQNGAVVNLVKHFQYADVGAVSARLLNGQKKSTIRSAINYLKKLESKTGSTLGVYGALYTLRKSCFTEIPNDTLLDDLLIPLHILLQGKKVKFECNAIVLDYDVHRFYSRERSLRIVHGLLQIALKHYNVIKSLPIRLKVYLFCQKYFKLYLPILLLLVVLEVVMSSNTRFISYLTFIITSILVLSFGIKESLLVFRINFNLIVDFLKLKKTTVKWEKIEKE